MPDYWIHIGWDPASKKTRLLIICESSNMGASDAEIMSMKQSIWPTFTLKDRDIHRYRIGPLTIFLKRFLDEIWVASIRDDDTRGDPAGLPEKPEWIRLALPGEFDEYRIRPVMPDRPVIIDTEHSYSFFSQTRTRVFSRVPAWVRITPASRDDLIIAELPTVVLSETWFGGFTEGELSYAVSSTARRILTEDLLEPHLVVCPMEIRNNSDAELKFEKVCLRVDRLSIFARGDALWSDETVIDYQGMDSSTDTEIKGVRPPEAGDAKLVSKPRMPVRKTIGMKTFRRLRDFHIPGF